MRAIVVLALLACVAATPARAQGWTPYTYPEMGVAVEFPAPPISARTAFPTPGGASVPAIFHSAHQGSVQFTLTVADFTTHPDDVDRALRLELGGLRAGGSVKADMDVCVSGQPGREFSLASIDGVQSRVSVFVVGARLYLLEAKSRPPDADSAAEDATRFQRSMRFSGDRLGPGPDVKPACGGPAPVDNASKPTP